VRVMGVDPGLTRCGLGVVEGGLGKPLRMIAVGVVRTPPSDDPAERLLTLQTEIDEWLALYTPDVVAVERVFAKANIKGIMGTAQASAVPMLAAARLGLPVVLHTPTEVKAAVTGNGRADKAQVTAMVTRILRLDIPPKPADAADALALAICHVWRGAAQDRLRLAVATQRAGR
jgi:crossover junction endodeoxyribonuclease RuvC